MIHLLSSTLRNFLADQGGATAIEYGLIVTAVFFGLIPVVNVIMHTEVTVVYKTINSYFASI